MRVVEFEVPGVPVTAGDKKIVYYGGRLGLANSEEIVNYQAYFKMIAATVRPDAPFDGPIRVDVLIFLLKPKSWPEWRIHPDTKPDVDNVIKNVFDSIQGVVISNDSRIISLGVDKAFGKEAKVRVRVEELLCRRKRKLTA